MRLVAKQEEKQAVRLEARLVGKPVERLEEKLEVKLVERQEERLERTEELQHQLEALELEWSTQLEMLLALLVVRAADQLTPLKEECQQEDLAVETVSLNLKEDQPLELEKEMERAKQTMVMALQHQALAQVLARQTLKETAQPQLKAQEKAVDRSTAEEPQPADLEEEVLKPTQAKMELLLLLDREKDLAKLPTAPMETLLLLEVQEVEQPRVRERVHQPKDQDRALALLLPIMDLSQSQPQEEDLLQSLALAQPLDLDQAKAQQQQEDRPLPLLPHLQLLQEGRQAQAQLP